MTQDRAITLGQLEAVLELIEERCEKDGWISTKDWTTPLSSASANLYDFTYYVIAPETVPNGVLLNGLHAPSFKPGALVAQPSSHASGIVQGTVGATLVKVRVVSGQFRCGPGELLNVNGVPSQAPVGFCWTDDIFHRSYVEMLTVAAQAPDFFVSHWWGEPVRAFVACVANHAEMRRLGRDARYWVCAYANDQHSLVTELSMNPRSSSFAIALQKSMGLLLILDEELECSGPATPFTRIWCAFEQYLAIEQEGTRSHKHFSLDVSASHGNSVTTLADGIAPCDKIHQFLHEDGKHGFVGDPIPAYKSRLHAQNKAVREKPFPIDVMRMGMKTSIERASATLAVDKAAILNCIASRDLHLAPLETHPSYDHVNRHLRARFALAAWRRLTEQSGYVEEWGLPALLRAAEDMQQVLLDFTDCASMDNAALTSLASGIPRLVRNIQLGLVNCPVGDEGIAALAQALSEKGQLAEMRLSMNNLKLTDAGVAMLSGALPKSLRLLTLNFTGTGVADNSMAALARSMPPSLERLYLDFDLCENYSDSGVCALASALPAELRSLTLYFNSNPVVTDAAVCALAKKVPQVLSSMDICFCRCPNITDAGLMSLASAIPDTLEELTLDFSSTKVGDSGMGSFVHLPKLRVLCFWLNHLSITAAGLEQLKRWIPDSVEDVEMRFIGCQVSQEACDEATSQLLSKTSAPRVNVMCGL